MQFYYFGLGNPGEKYENTRHNAGRILLDRVAQRQSAAGIEVIEKTNLANKISLKSLILADSETIFVSPLCFMNVSGGIVKQFRDPERMLVIVYDDIDLPLGELRLSYNKSGAGHNGMLSVIKSLGTQKIVSLRVGVSQQDSLGRLMRPIGQGNVQRFVLHDFTYDELKRFDELAIRAEKIMTLLHTKGLEYTFSTYKS
jgi:peptidyl-tRNA hydrolase, PTH1 family